MELLKAYDETMAESDLKALYFMMWHYLFDILNTGIDFNWVIQMQRYLADILSVLALTMAAEGELVIFLFTI